MTTANQEGYPIVGSHWYKALEELSPVGIFFTDLNGNCHHVNQRWCEISGLTSEEAMGRGWVSGIHKEDLESVAAHWYESAKHNHPFHAEYRFVTPSGKTTWVVGDARAVLTEAGDVDGYIGTITDIDAAKRYARVLEQSNDRIRTIVTEMPILLFAFDKQKNLCAWNQEAENVTGYTAREMIGNPNAMELLCPNTVNRNTMPDNYMHQEDDYRDLEWGITDKNGVHKFLACSNISKHHPIDGWSNWRVGVDVTDRRYAEHKLQERIKELSLLYKLSLLSNRHNLDLDVLLSEVVKLLPLAFQYQENTCARIIFEDKIFKTDSFDASEWILSSILYVRGRKIGLIEVYYLEEFPTEAEGPFLIEERLLIDEIALQLSRTIGHVLAKKDLALLDELNAKAGELEQFSHTVSHDLKTPLTAIGGFADLVVTLLDQGDISKAKYSSMRIIDVTRKMENRLNELLKLAKTGKIIAPTEKIDFKGMIAETVSMMAHRLEEANISVKVASSFPTVLGDRERLLETLEILLDNAIKYIGEKPNHINLGCRGEGDETIFFIKDNGVGIHPEQLDTIFGLFMRLDNHTDGDGAGLAIAKRIINAHGGQIWAESEGEGKGSCFCFTFGAFL